MGSQVTHETLDNEECKDLVKKFMVTVGNHETFLEISVKN